jgi:PBP1b-binding outer membrane lipoprotein LpoB
MNMFLRCLSPIIAVPALSALLAAACTPVRDVQPGVTQRREITEEPRDRLLDRPSVKEFKDACSQLARDLSASSLAQAPGVPLVIEIKPIEDRTEQNLDLTIYPETIREALMNMGHGRFNFRDERARDATLSERANQSDEPVRITRSESSDISGQKQTNRPGGITGPGGTGTPFTIDEKRHATEKKDQQVEVSGKVADVDYWLMGFVYRQDERTADVRRRGFRYFKFQFRLTDARTTLLAWERSYEVKNEGVLNDN